MNRQQQSVPPHSAPHIPVLLNEVVTALAPQAGELMMAHLGPAHSRALLEAADCAVVIDRDPDTKAHADGLSAEYGGRFSYLSGCFGDMQDLLAAPVDGVTLDLGVSSMQLERRHAVFLHARRAARYADESRRVQRCRFAQ